MDVLVVEDDGFVADAVLALLESAGHRARWARDGMHAFEALETFRPDVILLDVMMPRMDGFEFRRHQRVHPRYAAIPVVVVSASTDSDATDAAAFVRKPFGADDLLRVLEDVHARSR